MRARAVIHEASLGRALVFVDYRGMGESAEPCSRAVNFAAYREATRALWGESAVEDLVRAMPDDAGRAFLLAGGAGDAWVAERHVIALGDAAWDGPCGRDRATFHRWVDHMIDYGFGRVRRVLLSLANPPMLLRRAPDLWREDHTHGTFGYVPLAVDSARITLRDHPYIDSPVQRDAFAEALRHAMSLCNIRGVTAEETPAPRGALYVVLRWS